LTTPAAMDDLAPDHSPAWRGLAVSVLHVLVLNRLVRQRLGGEPKCEYVHLLRDVTDAAAAQRCQLAALVPPATMAHVEQIAVNLFLPEAADRPGVQLAQGALSRWHALRTANPSALPLLRGGRHGAQESSPRGAERAAGQPARLPEPACAYRATHAACRGGL